MEVEKQRNILLSANDLPDLDLGYQDSYHMHPPPHPHHDPADHDFSLAGSYPGSSSALTINEVKHQKWKQISIRQSFVCRFQT